MAFAGYVLRGSSGDNAMQISEGKIVNQGGETSRVQNIQGAKHPGGKLTKGRNVHKLKRGPL